MRSGLATAANEATGRRPWTIYRITEKGRVGLTAWLKTPARPPTSEIESLLRVAYADFDSKEQLLTQIRALSSYRGPFLIGVNARCECGFCPAACRRLEY